MNQGAQSRRVLLLLVILLSITERGHALMRCKQELMKNFYLLGMPYAIVEKMHICPHVHDKCCSIADEVKVSHLWNNHTQPIVSRYTDIVVNNINTMLRNFFKVVAMDPEMMVLKYVVPRQVPFKYKQCTTLRNVPESSRDRKELKEYSTGFMRYLNRNVWKFKMRKKKKVKRAKGGFSNEKLPNYVTHTSCSTFTDMFYREFVVVNQEKTEYCIGIHDKYMDFRIRDFISLLPSVKLSLKTMVNMKRAFYCHLCDAHMHQYFDLKKKTIQMSKGFCNRLLKKQIDYFRFMHIILIEFASQLLQYQACFETDGQVFEFPFKTFLTKYLRRIPIIKKCLSSLTDKKSFYKNCWMLCEQYQYYTFSSFFDGDPELLRRINVSLISFQRKLTRAKRWQDKLDKKAFKFAKFTRKEQAGMIGKELLLPENVDGTLIEPLNPSHMITDKKFYFKKDDRVRLINQKDANQWSVGYRSDQTKHFFKLNTQLVVKKQKKIFSKVKTNLLNQLKRIKGKYVPPAPKKFKLPLKAPIRSISGDLDKLSTTRFSSHLHSGLYPQRSLFLTTADHATPEQAAYRMNISDEEKTEMLKSFGNQPGPEPRSLSMVDEGDHQTLQSFNSGENGLSRSDEMAGMSIHTKKDDEKVFKAETSKVKRKLRVKRKAKSVKKEKTKTTEKSKRGTSEDKPERELLDIKTSVKQNAERPTLKKSLRMLQQRPIRRRHYRNNLRRSRRAAIRKRRALNMTRSRRLRRLRRQRRLRNARRVRKIKRLSRERSSRKMASLKRKLANQKRQLLAKRRLHRLTRSRTRRLKARRLRSMRLRAIRLRRTRQRKERQRRQRALKRSKMLRLRSKLNRLRQAHRRKLHSRKRHLLRVKQRKLDRMRQAKKRRDKRLRGRKLRNPISARKAEKKNRSRLTRKFEDRRNRKLVKRRIRKNELSKKPKNMSEAKYKRMMARAKKRNRKTKKSKIKAVAKKRNRSKRSKKKKKKRKVVDKLTKRKRYKFGDFFEKRQKAHPKKILRKKKVKYPFIINPEAMSQIFERIEEKINISDFQLIFEKKGLNPLHNIELINYRYNITRLIEMRYKLPEKLSRTSVHQYMLVNEQYMKNFNTDMDKDLDVYEDVSDVMIEINWYKQLRKKVMLGNKNPLYIQQINYKIRTLMKKAKENAARKEVVKKAMKARMNRKGHTDINHNKYPFFHHHHDLYFNDTFHGIAEMFTHIFGS